MFDSLLNILGSPQVMVTVASTNTSEHTRPSISGIRRSVASNSTTIDVEDPSLRAAEISEDISLSPVKLERDNSMSNSDASSASSVSEHNLSLYMKHNIDAINLDDSETQKLALHYLLEKIRDMESLLIESVKDNKNLRDDVDRLFHQNDSLAAENLTLKELISGHDEAKRILGSQLDELTGSLNKEKRKYDEDQEKIENQFLAMKGFATRICHSLEYLDEKMMEVQALADRNQLQLEIQQEELIRLEKEITITNQYNRRQNLIIDGIPDDVPQHLLEQVCLDIVHEIGFLPVGSYEVVGCHRLKKKASDASAPTIIRFVNRKVSEYCMKNRWKLKKLSANWKWNINFREDLCDANLTILNECQKLKTDGKVHNVYTFNGFVRVVKTPFTRPIKIAHINDVETLCK